MQIAVLQFRNILKLKHWTEHYTEQHCMGGSAFSLFSFLASCSKRNSCTVKYVFFFCSSPNPTLFSLLSFKTLDVNSRVLDPQ